MSRSTESRSTTSSPRVPPSPTCSSWGGGVLRPSATTAQWHRRAAAPWLGDALGAAGLPVVVDLVAPAEQYSRDGAEAMRALLALPEPPDAVFCLNDLLAVGALRAAAEQGVVPPILLSSDSTAAKRGPTPR
jgi:hypothetical protein